MRHARGAFLALLLVAAVAAAGAYAFHVLNRVFVLRIATGPPGSFSAQFATAIVHLVALDHPRVAVRSLARDSEADALKALEAGEADLAVARSDSAPAPGLSVAVVRHDAGLFIVPHGHKADSVAGLHGLTIGVVGASVHDMDLLAEIRREYGLPDHPDPVPLTPSQVADALRTRKVEALFVVGTPAGKTVAQTLAAVRSGSGGPGRLITVDEADAIVKRNHLLEIVDLPKGAIQGSPPMPDDGDSTLGVSTRLFATARMPNAVAAEVTRMLLTDKQKVTSLIPPGSLVEAPETDKINASLPVHPGTSAYLSGNQPSLSDEAQNTLYWVGIIGSLLASTAAAAMALVRRIMPKRPDATLKMLDLWVAAREAPDDEALRALEQDVDALVQQAIRRQAEGKDDEIPASFPLIVGQVRRAIDRRRSSLAAPGVVRS